MAQVFPFTQPAVLKRWRDV